MEKGQEEHTHITIPAVRSSIPGTTSLAATLAWQQGAHTR